MTSKVKAPSEPRHGAQMARQISLARDRFDVWCDLGLVAASQQLVLLTQSVRRPARSLFLMRT
jgi:hypothetical protein